MQSFVAEECLKENVDIINDVSGGNYDKNMFKIIAEAYCPYICMHMRGCPKTMSSLNNYINLTSEIINELKINVNECEKNNIYK